MSQTPLLQAVGGEESAAAAGDQFCGIASDDGERSPKHKRAAPSDVKKLDEKPERLSLRSVLALAKDDLPPLTPDLIRAARRDEKVKQVHSSLEALREESTRFADSAAASSIAAEAASFSKAIHKFDAGRDKKKRVADTELGKAGRILSAAALRAPASEAALAAVAIRMTGESLDILLTEEGRKLAAGDCWCRCPCWPAWLDRLRAAVSGPEPTLPVHRRGQIKYESLYILPAEEDQKPAVGDCSCGLCRCACWPACLEWLRAAVSGPKPILPVHRNRREKLMAKRQVLFGVVLAAPVALLTSAAATNIFPLGSKPWIAGATAFVWVAVSAAIVANQYGETALELQAASCLGRLGVMAVAVLFCIYSFYAFFPSVTIALVLLVACAVALHGCLCIVGYFRGDDDQSSASSGGPEETGCACRCCGCRIDV